MPSRTRQKTRTAILSAGLELFQNPGYYKTDIRAIARTADIAIGSFYNYFPDKLHLYLAVYRQEHEKIAERFLLLIRQGIPENPDPRALVLNLLQFQASAHNHSKTFYLESDLLGIAEPEVAQLKNELDSRLLDRLYPVLKPLVRPDISLELGLPILYDLIESTIHSLDEDSEDRKGQIITELAAILNSYLFR